jgi:hypothetical protein
MARFFQLPNFKRDDYNRPEQKWTCGRACDGKGCPFGPDPQGHCHTTGACQPARSGDRWACTRPETHGGTCAEGPLPNGECCHQIGPCQPLLSLRARRGRWTWGAVACTAGLLLCLFAGRGRARWEDPGALTAPHALSSTRCDDCHNPGDASHVAAMGGMGGLLAGVHRPTDEKCLQCHSLGDQPLAPHGLAPDALARSREATARSAFGASHAVLLALARMTKAPGQDRGALECVTCHQEHHGRDRSLTAFTNQQCQVCHQAAFASFSRGHPDFTDYPYKRRTRIIFDHASHLQVHFADKAFAGLAPKECAACHAASPTGAFMLVKNFEQTCAACHAGQIEGEGRAGDKGIAFFRVPGLDAATLAEKGHPVGEWPADADGKLTPFMRLLLARDPAAAAALAKLDGVDLTDLHAATEDRLAAAAALAWSVKSLFADLVTDGQQAMETRLGQLDPAVGRGQLGAMTGQLPRDGLAAAQAAWFPGLLTEVANYRAGIRPAAAVPAAAQPPVAAAPAPKAPAAAGDDLLDGPATPAPAKVAATPAKPADDDLSADTPAPAPKPAVPAAPKPAADDDLSADTPAPARPSPAAPPAKAATGDDLAADTPAPPPPAARPAAPVVSPLKAKDPEDWAVAGGWYRSADNYTLYYRPTGHADAFLTVWLTAVGRLATGDQARAAKPVFAELTDAKAPGLCIKCHSLETSPTGDAVIVNWKANVPLPSFHRTTKFKHATHFSLVMTEGCQTCHVLRAPGDLAASYAGTLDPTRFTGSFAPVSRQTCVSCHNDRVAREDCLLCHNYHVGEFASKASTFGPMQASALKPGVAGPHL